MADWEKGHPYAWRTRLRSHLPWFLVNLGVADKGEDCARVGAKHHWYNIDGETSGCYHCQVVAKGQLWKRSDGISSTTPSRTARTGAALGGVVTLSIAVAAVWGYAETNRRDAIRSALESEAAALKSDMTKRFPVGSPSSEVVAYLDARGPTTFRNSTPLDYWFSVGQEPGRLSEWYCGNWEIGVKATFKGGRFLSADVTRWSVDCL